MSNQRWVPRAAIVRADALDLEAGVDVLRRLRASGVAVQISNASVEECLSALRIPRNPVHARRVMFVERRPPRHVRPEAFASVITRTDHYFGTTAMNCPFACHYCYLYANSAGVRPLSVYVDLSAQLEAIDAAIAATRRALVFNFGEDGDSLAVEHLTGSAGRLIRWFATRNADLELRTKAPLTNELLGQEHCGRTIIGASVAPVSHVRKFESGTATLADRLGALIAYRAAGYRIAVKIEPAILTGEWRQEYRELIAMIAQTLGREVEHVSLGCLRFKSTLEQESRAYFHSKDLWPEAREEYVYERYSYPRAARIAFYEFALAELDASISGVPVYLSMENTDVCRAVGAEPWLTTPLLSPASAA